MGVRPPIDGARILITGASSGIGRAMARILAPRAAGLAIVARRAERLEALAEELRASNPSLTVCVAPCDLTDQAATEAMVTKVEAELGPVDVLINNAGFGYGVLFERSSWDKTQRMITLNVDALVWLTWRLVPGMVERGRGGVLNVSSGLGLQWVPGYAAYGATKYFVTGFTESLRSELHGTGVAASQVCPGPVDTEYLDVAGNAYGEGDPPGGAMSLSAEQCAAKSLAAFERGRAIILPGFLYRLTMWISAISPRWLTRFAMRGLAKKARAKALTIASEAAAQP